MVSIHLVCVLAMAGALVTLFFSARTNNRHSSPVWRACHVLGTSSASSHLIDTITLGGRRDYYYPHFQMEN